MVLWGDSSLRLWKQMLLVNCTVNNWAQITNIIYRIFNWWMGLGRDTKQSDKLELRPKYAPGRCNAAKNNWMSWSPLICKPTGCCWIGSSSLHTKKHVFIPTQIVWNVAVHVDAPHFHVFSMRWKDWTWLSWPVIKLCLTLKLRYSARQCRSIWCPQGNFQTLLNQIWLSPNGSPMSCSSSSIHLQYVQEEVLRRGGRERVRFTGLYNKH